MKKLILTFIIYHFGIFLYAQNFKKDSLNKHNIIFSKNHFFVGLGGFVSKGKTNILEGRNEKLNPLFGLGHQIQIGYDTHLNKKNTWRLTLELGQLPINYDFMLYPDKYPELEYEYSGMPSFFGAGQIPFVSISNTWIKRFSFHKDYIFDYGIGISIRYTPSGFYQMDYGLTKQSAPYVISDKITPFTIIDKENSFTSPFQFCPQFSVGTSKIFKNNNFLSLRMILNLSFQNHIRLQYTFFPEDRFQSYQTIGKYTSKGTYLGLNLTYHISKK